MSQKRKITGLNIYPVKSLGGLSVSSAVLTKKGLQYDRKWMLLDAGGRFMTQRTFPRMALISLQIESGKLHFTHRPTEKTAAVDILENYGENFVTKIWRDTCTVQKVGAPIDTWLSEVLQTECTLVFFPDESMRTKTRKNPGEERTASLADEYPILLLNELSFADVNTRTEEDLSIDRFRGNIIFAGEKNYEEDTFNGIRLAEIDCPTVETCGRCPLINVNQTTAEKGREPLQTLTNYRRNLQSGEVKFGLGIDCKVPEGTAPVINVGDFFTIY